MKRGKPIPQKPWMGVMGFLGFLGFSYFHTGQPYTLVFLAFFGFFSYFWWGKMHGQVPDERLIENFSRAAQNAYGGAFAAVFAGTILLGNFFDYDMSKAYAATVALVALGFAVALNLAAFLTWCYDQGE